MQRSSHRFLWRNLLGERRELGDALVQEDVASISHREPEVLSAGDEFGCVRAVDHVDDGGRFSDLLVGEWAGFVGLATGWRGVDEDR